MQTVFLGKASAPLPTAHSYPIHSYIHRGCIHRQSKKKDLEKEKTKEFNKDIDYLMFKNTLYRILCVLRELLEEHSY